MICQNCNKHIPENSSFCRFCGAVQHVLHGQHEGREKERYAGFSIRLLAYIFDYALILFIFTALAVALGEETYNSIVSENSTLFTYLAFFLYNIFFLSTWSKTPGKALYGLHVTLIDTNKDLDFITSAKRSLFQILSTFLFGIGYWNMSSDEHKQAFHDKRAGTLVLQRSKNLILPIILTLLALGFIAVLFIIGSES